MTNPTPHRATPEQWAIAERYLLDGITSYACIVELRDRLAAAEQRISEVVGNHPAKPDSSTPAGSLVEVVAQLITPTSQMPCNDLARAAILAVADWLHDHEVISAARIAARLLRQEVERHG